MMKYDSQHPEGILFLNKEQSIERSPLTVRQMTEEEREIYGKIRPTRQTISISLRKKRSEKQWGEV